MDVKIKRRSEMPAFFPQLLVIFLVAISCKSHEDHAVPESYVEDGVVWAYGSVELTHLTTNGSVMLKKVTTDQDVDGAGQYPEGQYEFVGAIEAITGGTGKRSLAYVDYHPEESNLLAYAHDLQFKRRANRSETIDIFANLKKSGQSYFKRQSVYLGAATFRPGASEAPVQLASGLRLSAIANGVYTGQWALHYPAVELVNIVSYQGLCSPGVTQRPGQAPGQNPLQKIVCRPIPAAQDLCGGNPTQNSCRPRAPVAQVQTASIPAPSQRVTDGLFQVGGNYERVFELDPGVTAPKLTFVSEVAVASEEENRQLCVDQFMAVGRTTGDEVNNSCILRPAPATSSDGRLACSVSIEFVEAETYMSRVCNVTGFFKVGNRASETVQVLKR